MKKIFLSFWMIFLFAVVVAQEPSHLTGDEAFLSEVRLLESWIQQQMVWRNIPGLAVGIVYEREPVYARGFGYADLEKKTPVTPQSLFRLASNSKTFTATAVMQLRDAGRLRLDDPVDKYLPGFSIGNPFPDAPPITIYHLLTHTSGLPREAAFPYWTDRHFPTLQQILDSLPHQEMIYPPGERIKYSNLGMALLGEIVAVASGMSYEEYVTTRILRPLGMEHTYVTLDERERAQLVTPYSRRFPDGSRRVMPFTDARGLTPAAGITSCIDDLTRYVALQFSTAKGEGAVLSKYTLEEMHRLHFPKKDWSGGYGLGFRVWRDEGLTVCGHGGWVAGNRSQISFIPSEKVGVIVLTNADDVPPSFFATRILHMMVPVIRDIVSSKAAVPPAPDPQWKKFTGLYSDPSWYETEIMIYRGQLVMNNHSYPPADDPHDDLVRLTPAGPRTFVMDGPNGNGEKVVFIMDANDQVVKVKVGENYLFPVR